MKQILISMLLVLSATTSAFAQGSIKGKVLDRQTSTPLQFVNIKITTANDTNKMVRGGVTDTTGYFAFSNMSYGQYVLTISYIGYKTEKRHITLNGQNRSATLAAIYMDENAKMLKGVEVKGRKPAMKLEVDRKSYDVGQMISNSGQAASDVLDNIPSVEVDNDGNVSLRGNSSVEVWINGKASGLTSDNRAEILQQIPAESIDHVEIIDNPSAKFSAEGSAGIINIVLKKNRKAGYYGSMQAGADTRGGANASSNINFSNSKIDTYVGLSYRHRANSGYSDSRQDYIQTNQYQNYHGTNDRMGNNIFGRAGITWHATSKDDLSLSGMVMTGKMKQWENTPYHYGTIGASSDTRVMTRRTTSIGDMDMYHGELDYKHEFSSKHFIEASVSYNNWKSDNSNLYQDSTTYNTTPPVPTEYLYQSRPLNIHNNSWEAKIDYENAITDVFKIQSGYQGNFSHENTPQESWTDSDSWNGVNATEDKSYFNRFIYDLDIHALYFTAEYKLGKFNVMGGLRGEYWHVNTKSYTWEQEHDASLRDKPFKKDYFQLFPSIFISYQMTPNDQLMLNYTRRLRRPRGGELNSFRNTRDATMVSFGNPELTPEYSNSISFNYLHTWTLHSLLVSAYYRPTTDVIERINWTSSTDGIMYQTSENVARSTSSGLEVTLKNNLFRILDLTTNVNAYYYKLNGFSYDIDGQTVTGKSDDNFTWNARMTASLALPYDISVQMSGRYRSKQIISQGYRKANYRIDLGVRKNFFNKKLTLAVNCRDLLNSRKWQSHTSSSTFTRSQTRKRGGRNVSFTLTWNFGNTNAKKNNTKRKSQTNDEDNSDSMDSYDGSSY